jgi:hypothetical protein
MSLLEVSGIRISQGVLRKVLQMYGSLYRIILSDELLPVTDYFPLHQRG